MLPGSNAPERLVYFPGFQRAPFLWLRTAFTSRATLRLQVLPKGQIPHTRHVRGSNYALIGVFEDRIPGFPFNLVRLPYTLASLRAHCCACIPA